MKSNSKFSRIFSILNIQIGYLFCLQLFLFQIVASAQNSDGCACPGTSFVSDIDGNVYSTVQIGTQCWLKENMRALHYADGQRIEAASSQTDYDRPLCYRPSGSVEAGLLYNWPAASRGLHSSQVPSQVQGVCPAGWHLPSQSEWEILLDYVGTQSIYRLSDNDLCVAKALASTDDWLASPDDYCVGNRTHLNNVTGFSALPSGDFCGAFAGDSVIATFWSSTVNDYGGACYLALRSYSAEPALNVYRQSDGRSVRCLKNPDSQCDITRSASDTVARPQDGQPCANEDSVVTDVDGNQYLTVQIGTQCWMKENLRTTRFPNGKEIALGKKKDGYTPLRYAPKDSLARVPEFGFLYNWCAAMNESASSTSNPSGVQGICPDGWHLPSASEWQQLVDYQDGIKLLEPKPAGLYESGYDGFGNDAYYWSATAQSKTLSYFFALGDSVFNENIFYYYCGDGFSVRCVRNAD